MANVTVTVNGVPVEEVIDANLRAEYRANRNLEVDQMSLLVARTRQSIVRSIRNHSGSKSGRGRVIYSNPAFEIKF